MQVHCLFHSVSVCYLSYFPFYAVLIRLGLDGRGPFPASRARALPFTSSSQFPFGINSNPSRIHPPDIGSVTSVSAASSQPLAMAPQQTPSHSRALPSISPSQFPNSPKSTDSPEILEEGRGQRKRNIVSYNDGLSDDAWALVRCLISALDERLHCIRHRLWKRMRILSSLLSAREIGRSDAQPISFLRRQKRPTVERLSLIPTLATSVIGNLNRSLPNLMRLPEARGGGAKSL